MKPSRIVVFATTLEDTAGGIARSVPRFAAALAETGIEVVLLSPRPNHCAVPSGCFSNLIYRTAGNYIALRRLIREAVQAAGSSVIGYHAGIWSPLNHLFATEARTQSMPYVASPRSSLDPWSLRFRGAKKRLAWWAYAKKDLEAAAFIHATSTLESKHISQLSIRPPVAVIPHGVDHPPAASQIPSVPKAHRRLLFLSRLDPRKGLEDLLAAFPRSVGPDWELVIAGDGPRDYVRKLQALAEKTSKGRRVKFIGHVTGLEKWAWYQSADIFVLPSYGENFGLAVAEALSMGVPVITTSATPWGEVSLHHCGWITDVGQAGLAAALQDATSRASLELQGIGQNGREWVRASFSWDSTAASFLLACRQQVVAA